MSIIKLPVSKPPISGYHFHAYPLSVIFAHQKLHAWFFSHYINIFCTQLPDGNPFYDFVSYNIWERISCFSDAHLLDYHAITSCHIDIVELCISYLDRGWYVYVGLDDFYIPFRSAYQKNSQPHDIFFYGYNSESKCFYTAGFNAKEVYSFDQLHFDDFNKAYFSDRMAANRELTKMFDFCRFFTIAPGFTYEFDKKLTCGLLYDYIHSVDTTEKFRMYLSPGDNRIYGLNTYKKLRECYRSMMDTDTEPDIHAVQLFWEHKKCMLMRIQYMIEIELLPQELRLYEDYSTIAEKALNIRNLLLKYMLTMNKRNLQEIINTLPEMEEMELSILTRLLNALDA